MYLRTFFSILISIVILTYAGYCLSVKFFFDKAIPDAPCSMEIVNGDFINDQYENFQFNGAVTLWLKNNIITAFGVYNTANGMKKLSRSILLDHIKKSDQIVTANVKSVKISTSDQIHYADNFFGGEGEQLTLHFQKIKHGEYLVMINNNWVAVCKEH
ncbi:hypothetical protein GA565_22255 [Rouxiella sp. S1S-2]|nr:hypothetical protein GA565_22255 [Rouxiella sp. S1S-2]